MELIALATKALKELSTEVIEVGKVAAERTVEFGRVGRLTETENVILGKIQESFEGDFADFGKIGAKTKGLFDEHVTKLSTDINVCTDVLGEDVAVVTGNPFENAERLDFSQGDNSYEAGGCCGLVSSSNFLNLCGLETTEEEIVGYAMENNLCANGFFMPRESVGGTGDVEIETILENYGIPVTSYNTYNGGSIEDIADAIDEGRAVTIGVNAGYLWDEPSFINGGQANHQITVTGAVRNLDGETIGLVICDSGRGLEEDACRIVSREAMELCYENVPGASAIMTDNAVR